MTCYGVSVWIWTLIFRLFVNFFHCVYRSCEEMAPNPKKQKTETRGSDSDQTE